MYDGNGTEILMKIVIYVVIVILYAIVLLIVEGIYIKGERKAH